MTRRKRTKADRTEESPHPGRAQGGNIVSIETIGHTYVGAPSAAQQRRAFRHHIEQRMDELREEQAAKRAAK